MMTKPWFKYLKRIILICTFISIDVFLGIAFIKDTGFSFQNNTQPLFDKVGIKIPDFFLSPESETQKESVDEQELIRLINSYRHDNQLTQLNRVPALDQAAEKMIQEFEKNQYHIETGNYDQQLVEATKQSGYKYSIIADAAIVGPTNAQAVFDAWIGNQQQTKSFLEKDFVNIGIKTITTLVDDAESGVSVVILAAPLPASQPQATPLTLNEKKPSQTVYPAFKPARDISDNEVIAAINQYRADHQVHQLVVDDHLCQYAQKRVQDLIAFGTLDNHAGFKADFDNPENLPESIKSYSGGTIGENLASQYCINGTTGQSFVAETGTALIEWCFDSSVKGHREAQLNTRYNAVCVRHGKNMYVVIFGE